MKILRRFLGLFGPRPMFWSYHPGAKCPKRSTGEAAGLDLYASQHVQIPIGETRIIMTGVRCDFLPGWVALIWDRSGLGVKGLHRFAGVIDSDYRGAWGVVMHNTTDDVVVINRGDRVAQVIFQRCWVGTPRWGKPGSTTERGEAGFGSTGR